MNCTKTCPLSGIKRIFLATDGSEFSAGAEREAIRFAKRISSKLTVMSAMVTFTDYEGFSAAKLEAKKESELRKCLDSVQEKASKETIECESIIGSGTPHEAIVEEARKSKADIIFIGRRGRKGLAKLLLGEEAAKVIANAPCVVMVVPRAAKIDFKSILVATDGSVHSLAAVAEAVGIAKCCGSGIIAVSAMRDVSESDEAKANVEKVVEIAENNGVPVETLTPVGRSYDVIVETAAGRGVDLIVVGTYGKTGIKKMFMGSSTEKVISNAGCAVLIVKAQ